MCERAQPQTATKSGQVTLGHLLMLITLFMPAAGVIGEVELAGGGVLRYLFGLPLALVLGGLVVLLDWFSGRFLWQRSQRYGDKPQTIVAIGLFALQLVWLMLAVICGYRMAHLVIKF
jgi:hypothetical protein